MTAPSKREQELSEKAVQLTAHIYDQTRKRQYLNAAHAASELVTALLGAFAEVLHPPDPKPAHPCTCPVGMKSSRCLVHGMKGHVP